jgi:hypothetical protein
MKRIEAGEPTLFRRAELRDSSRFSCVDSAILREETMNFEVTLECQH